MEKYDGILNIDVKIGDFVFEDTSLGTIYLSNNQQERFTEEDKDLIADSFIFQDNKIPGVDYRYFITKLLDIALRASSASVNEPNSVIHAINKLGLVLGPLAKTDSYNIKMAERGESKIYYTSFSFDEDLKYVFMPWSTTMHQIYIYVSVYLPILKFSTPVPL